MKSADIVPGTWYAYNSNPTGRWGRTTIRVYVFDSTSKPGSGNSFSYEVQEGETDEVYREVNDPVRPGATIKVPREALRRWSYSGSNQKGWLVGYLQTGRKTWEYVLDDLGEHVLDEDGDWVTRDVPQPDLWRFASVRPVCIVSTWEDHLAEQERLAAQRKANDEAAAVYEAKRRTDNGVLADKAEADLAEFGLTLADVLGGEKNAEDFRLDAGHADRNKVAAALVLAAKVSEHTANAVLTVHR